MELENASGAGQGLTCTLCSNPLKAIRTPDRITVHACAPCRSVWLDGGAIADAGWGAGLPEPTGTQQTNRMCPRCSGALLELTYQTPRGEMLVDYCESCSGLRVEQTKLSELRELAMSTRAAGETSSADADSGGGAGDLSGERPVVTRVQPERSGAPAKLIIVLLAVVVLGGGYVLWQSGSKEPPSESARGMPETLMRQSMDTGGFYSAIPALQEFFKQFGRWPDDADELATFSAAQGFPFDLSKFDYLRWDEKDNGGLVLHWKTKGAAKEGTFHVSQPIMQRDTEF